MTITTINLLTVLLTGICVCVSAVPHEKRWGPGGWGGNGWPGPSSSASPTSGRWPFSGNYGGWNERSNPPSPSATPPTVTLQKKNYLEYEEKAETTGSCDLQNALNYMDLSAVSPALPPPTGLTLFQVALGRGTQNYTCDLSNATAVPEPIGAVATLFNFSCVAAQKPALLKKLTAIALNQAVPSTNNTDQTVLDDLTSGHHYFLNSTTPFFNLDTPKYSYGMGALAKANASDAPTTAPTGQHGTTGYGAVQWLRLDQVQYAEHDWQTVYRLNTAGGDPPKTCTGQPAAFEIPYAAEYWIFK